jgi:hypothetical protein
VRNDDANVRFGSETDIPAGLHYVRYSPESRHLPAPLACPLCAKSGHWRVFDLAQMDSGSGQLFSRESVI